MLCTGTAWGGRGVRRSLEGGRGDPEAFTEGVPIFRWGGEPPYLYLFSCISITDPQVRTFHTYSRVSAQASGAYVGKCRSSGGSTSAGQGRGTIFCAQGEDRSEPPGGVEGGYWPKISGRATVFLVKPPNFSWIFQIFGAEQGGEGSRALRGGGLLFALRRGGFPLTPPIPMYVQGGLFSAQGGLRGVVSQYALFIAFLHVSDIVLSEFSKNFCREVPKIF